MSKPLEQRLQDSLRKFDEMHLILNRKRGEVHADVENILRSFANLRDEIAGLIELVEVRRSASRFLNALETRADENDNIVLNGLSLKYHHVRFIGVQAYVSTAWAIADRITGMVGRILCTQETGSNASSLAKIPAFIKRDIAKKSTAALLVQSVRQTFGWPIGLSYAIRNHFLHDGAQWEGRDFFEGTAAAAAFRISDAGWKLIEKKAIDEYGVNDSCHRAGARWPVAPKEDLRSMLQVIEQEMDDALGVLWGSAWNSLLGHLGFILGED
jgi:hypothetical protein